MMNLYFLFVVFLYIERCNARVVPLDFRPNEPKEMDSRISENELVESSEGEVEILGHNLPDIKQNDDLEFLISEDRNKSSLENSNRSASNQSLSTEKVISHITSTEKDLEENSNLGKTENLTVTDLAGKEFNSTSEFISKNNSDSKEPLETPQINETRNEAIANLTVKNETFPANKLLSDDLEHASNIEFMKEETLNDSLDHQNETSAIFQVFDVNNNTENSRHLQPMSNETEMEGFLINAENITVHKNETSEISEVFNSINNTDNFQLRPVSNDTEVDAFLSDAENITEEFRPNNFTSENMDIKNDSVKSEGGILSGFEFLINSEVARNAAKAMEVFNFTDSLTDHIMEENEFHSFLPSFNAEQNFHSINQTGLKNEISITNRTGESSKIQTGLNISMPSVENLIVLNQTEALEFKNISIPFDLNEPLKEENETELFNFAEKLERNSSEASPNLENRESLPETVTPKENITRTDSNSTAVGVPECPSPGWCIFWFLSQDTCAVNEHCLGNRICCKIRCSKTCIEVESL